MNDDSPAPEAQSEIGFFPYDGNGYGYVVVYAPPVKRESKAGIDLSQVESLDANLPLRGRVVATAPYTGYALGDEVLIRRYTGIQAEFNDDSDHWIMQVHNGEILGRFDTAPRGASQE